MDGRMGDLFKEIVKGDDTSFHPLMLRLPIILPSDILVF